MTNTGGDGESAGATQGLGRDQPQQLQQPEIERQPELNQPVTVLGLVERILAASAVVGAGIYVLMNSLYINFYDDFGVRPEEVGWDRLAILGRAGVIALFLIYTLSYVALVSYPLRRLRRRAAAAAKLHGVRSAQPQHLGDKTVSNRPMNWSLIAAIGGLAGTALIVGFFYINVKVEDEATRVAHGQSVNGVGPVAPFVDVRANRADVVWLGDKDKRPKELDAPHLMYLGRGNDIVVLLACGKTTLTVPADDVMVLIRDQGDSKMSDAEQESEFRRLCP
jgi:hypothetical protein